MKVLAYQGSADLYDKSANINRIDSVCKSAVLIDTDVAVFPELFITGYNLGDRVHQLAETIDGESISQLKEIASKLGIVIICGFVERMNNSLYNSAVAISANGELLSHHRKVFLFGEQEKSVFTAGEGFRTFTLAGYQCALSICYDVEFPEAVRDMAQRGAQILFNPTANMTPYFDVPTTLVRARALENGVAIVYANLCGKEVDQEYTGLSGIVAPDGCDLARAGSHPTILIADLSTSIKQAQRSPFTQQLKDIKSWKEPFHQPHANKTS